MSGTGINPLAIYDPQTYAQQIAIQRRQALAQSLLEQGGSNPGNAAYGGLRNAGNAILGAFLAKRADKQLGDLYNPQPQTGGVDPGQVSNSSGSGPIMSQPDQASMTDTFARRYNMTPQEVLGSNGANQAGQPPGPQGQQNGQGFTRSDVPPDYALLPQQQQRIFDQLPHVPGATARETVNAARLGGASWSEFLKAHYDAMAQTPDMKNAAFANPGNEDAQRQAIGGVLNKSGTITGRAGNVLIGPDGKTNYVPPQAPPGYRYIQGQDGQPYLVQIAGGPQAVAGSALAQGAPKAMLSPHPFLNEDTGKYQPGNELQASGNQSIADQLGISVPSQGQPVPGQQPPPNITANNPLNVQANGRDIRYSTPTAGLGKAWETLGGYGQKGINTVNKIVATWTGNTAPPEYAASVAKALGVDPNQPLNMSDANLKGALIDAMRPNETGNKYAPPSSGTPSPQPNLVPQPSPGYETSKVLQSNQAFGKGSDYDITHAQASDVPTRLNVLQNIQALSQAGAPTGSSEWMNETRQERAAIQQALGGNINWNDPGAIMHEIQKYMGQYSNRVAETGNETDAKRFAAQIANPNIDMFPATLQRVVPWLMANEKGTLAKDNFLNLPQNRANSDTQLKAQQFWRNSYTPRIAQFEMMTPQQQAGFLNDPRAFASSADKMKFVKSALALHPYFQGQGNGPN